MNQYFISDNTSNIQFIEEFVLLVLCCVFIWIKRKYLVRRKSLIILASPLLLSHRSFMLRGTSFKYFMKVI